MNLLAQNDAGHRGADPFRSARWSDEMSDDAAHDIAVLVAARAIISRTQCELRALGPCLLARIDTPPDIAARLDDELRSVALSVQRIESGEAEEAP